MDLFVLLAVGKSLLFDFEAVLKSYWGTLGYGNLDLKLGGSRAYGTCGAYVFLVEETLEQETGRQSTKSL